MANVKITQLAADTNPASTDVLPFVDISADETKKVTIADLLENAGDGSASAPAFAFDDDSNTGIYRPGADQLAISTGGTNRLYIDSSGRLGIGTASPGNTLHLSGTNGVGMRIENTSNSISAYSTLESSGALQANISGAGVFSWVTGGGEKVRIDNSGRMLIGTSVSPSGGDSHAQAAPLLVQGRIGSDADSGRINLQRGSAASNDSSIGTISFTDSSNNAYARIEAEADAATGADDYPGRLVFSTTADGASSPTVAMTINRNGNVGIGLSSPEVKLHTKESVLVSNTTSGDGQGRIQIRSGGNVVDTSTHQIRCGGGTGQSLIIENQANSAGELILASNHASGTINFRTNSAERMRLDSSGHLGLGESDPDTRLHVKHSPDNSATLGLNTAATVLVENTSANGIANIKLANGLNADGHAIVYGTTTSGSLRFMNQAAERMRLDSTGRLLVGTSSSSGVNAKLQVIGDTAAQFHRGTNSASGASIAISKSRNTTYGSNTIVQDDDLIGTVAFRADDGTDYHTTAAFIGCNVDGTPGANDMPGRLTFSTTSSGANSSTERMRIDSLARITLGTQTDPSVVTEPPVTNFFTSATPTTNDTAGTGTWAANASIAPDGTKTASKFTAGSTPAQSRFSQVSSSVNLNSTAYTLSFYAKSESGSSQTHSVDLGDDQAGSITVTTSWQRFVFTSLVPTSGRFIDITGIDGNFSLWGVQIQTENAATSYVKPSGGVATTSPARATVGTRFSDYSDLFVAGNAEIDGNLSVNDALTKLVRNGDTSLNVNRLSSDGKLVTFSQNNTEEGDISVSGSTVSLTGAHLTRWSQLADGAERTEILRGSVLSNLDEMCEWQYGAQEAILYTAEDDLPEGVNVGDVKVPAVEASIEDNEQLNRMKVSDVEGDRNVAGVFQAWDDDDDTYTNDFYCAMTGDFVIRIAQGTTVARGDLLMSAGDGTAKPQDDDIVRSKTIAKVTSTVVSETYSDGSYCVPCVLMAC